MPPQTPTILPPLVRKPNKPRPRGWSPASVIEGIPHVVEGMPEGSFMTVPDRIRNDRGPRHLQTGGEGTYFGPNNLDEVNAAKEHNRGQRAQIDDFNTRQEARSRIKPIGDPEANKSEERRRASRRRMMGRLGTFLTSQGGGIGL